ncbi:helix-turn-helix domain-containing protein [Pimelobacter simplex]|uniref:helix-turn-helix domain-containing protein n=1 Tax=Nocardioides simplex TaxID=2045 RepID=UPI00214FDF37|nr:helix-turn-helix transcriptional regulator [Pimelobacter simplex]UUW88349.1 helix-turn-helix transcriptional regulator [Pimelobacter simplex]UUW97853.1 helix-turn-helix transcriptional regulator [Pimelobacter simplex]
MSHSELDLREATAGEVRAARARKQISLDVLSESCGIAKSTLSAKLRGLTDFTVPELIDIAMALGVSAADLLPPAAAEDAA